MSDFRRATVVKVDQESGVSRVLMQRNDKSYFVVLDYRPNATHTAGLMSTIPGVRQIEDFVNDRGTAFKQYSNEEISQGDTTALDLKEEPKVAEVPHEDKCTMAELNFAASILILAYQTSKPPQECIADCTKLAVTIKYP